MRLMIATPGLAESGDDPAPDSWPVLPALGSLLHRARPLPRAAGWRAGVLAALCPQTPVTAIPQAAMAARAAALPVGTPLCLATPLHVVAGISRVHLPPGGWLRLAPAEAARWADLFNAQFGETALRLQAVAGEWLLLAPFAAAARDAAPEGLVGAPLVRAPARDAAERALRRLGAEVEMWLSDQPLNREREARGLPVINSFWFWGGAHAMELPPCASPPRAMLVMGEADPWLAGLAAHCGLSLQPATDWRAVTACDDALLVLAPPPQGMTAAHWENLERQWFEPAAAALRTGRVRTLRLQVGSGAWQLPDASPLRWLRRARPWHQQVGA